MDIQYTVGLFIFGIHRDAQIITVIYGGGGGEWGYKGHIHEERCFTCEYIIIIKSQGEITYKKNPMNHLH